LIVLAFDTAQGALSAAVHDDEGTLASAFELRTRGHAEELMPMLETVLAEAALGFADLNALAVTIGPGTFTGLRAGLAAARGLALARELPLVGITTLEAIAADVVAGDDEVIVAAFDAKRGEVYLQAFDAAHAPLTEPALVAVADVAALLPHRKLLLVGTGAALLEVTLHGFDRRLADAPAQPHADAVARLALQRLEAKGLDAFRVAPAPLYIRAPDAKLPGGRDPGEAA
jgi:tRNA threonylcarbamoyladenosine biosynthesis protein TsaB